MRTRIGAALAVGAVAVLAAVTAAPAGAQEAPASLGFSVDRSEGSPGDQVNGQVDVKDVAANCTTSAADLQARFHDLFTGPFASAEPEGDLFSRFFPGGDFVFENHDQTAYVLTGFAVLGIGADFDGAAEKALPQTFVITFADIATQEPVGDRGNFDPATGAGSVAVPDVDPGPWAVAAACVGPVLDVDKLEAGIKKNSAFLDRIGAPLDPGSQEFADFVKDYLGDDQADVFAFLEAIGPDLVQSIVEPDALGVQVFCVHDAEGRCPTEAPPPTQPPAAQPPIAAPAQPVLRTPTFTG